MTHLVSSLVQWDLLGRGMSILPQNLPGLTLAASGPSLSTWVCRGFLPVLKNASLVAQLVNSIPAMQETRVQSLGQEDPLQEMATHSSILAGRIPLTEEPGKLVCGVTRGGHDLGKQNWNREGGSKLGGLAPGGAGWALGAQVSEGT